MDNNWSMALIINLLSCQNIMGISPNFQDDTEIEH